MIMSAASSHHQTTPPLLSAAPSDRPFEKLKNPSLPLFGFQTLNKFENFNIEPSSTAFCRCNCLKGGTPVTLLGCLTQSN